jgi:hypothetical protein
VDDVWYSSSSSLFADEWLQAQIEKSKTEAKLPYRRKKSKIEATHAWVMQPQIHPDQTKEDLIFISESDPILEEDVKKPAPKPASRARVREILKEAGDVVDVCLATTVTDP